MPGFCSLNSNPLMQRVGRVGEKRLVVSGGIRATESAFVKPGELLVAARTAPTANVSLIGTLGERHQRTTKDSGALAVPDAVVHHQLRCRRVGRVVNQADGSADGPGPVERALGTRRISTRSISASFRLTNTGVSSI